MPARNRHSTRLVSALLVVGLGAGAAEAATPGAGRFHTAGPRQDPVPQDSAVSAMPAEILEALRVSERLMVLRDSVEDFLVAPDTAVGPRQQVQRFRVRGWLVEAGDLQESLVELVSGVPGLEALDEGSAGTPAGTGASPREEGVPDEVREALATVRSRMVDYTRWLRVAYEEQRAIQEVALDSLSAARAQASLDQIAVIDGEGRLRRGQVDSLFIAESELLLNSEALGLDVADGWRSLEQAASARADGLAGRLRLAQLDEERLRRELADAERAGLSTEETARVRRELGIVQRLLGDLSATLGVTSDFLDARGFETAGYRQLVIEATGSVTGDILDWDVLTGLVGKFADDAGRWVRRNGPTLLVRLVVVLLCIALGRIGVHLVWWLLRATGLVRLPRLARQLAGRMMGPLGTVLGLGVGLAAIGADGTTILAGAGVLSVVVGFALQDSLANFAAGFMILLYRPFDQDDTIEAAGIVGTVRSMGLANTTLVTFDNRKLSVPNSKLWGTVIANRSSEPTRRAEAVVRVGFDQDLSAVSEIILDRLRDHEMVLEDPAPSVYVSGAAESWMQVTVWAWTKNQDWWAMTASMPALLKNALEAQGIPVPLPTQQLVGPLVVGQPN